MATTTSTTTTTDSRMLSAHAPMPSEDGRRSARSASSYHSAASYLSSDHPASPYHAFPPTVRSAELHLVNVDENSVRIVPGSDALVQKLGLPAFPHHHDDGLLTPAGPPPPSPPASVHRIPLVESPEQVSLRTPVSDPLRAPAWSESNTRLVGLFGLGALVICHQAPCLSRHKPC
jgi:hypothetical protein